MRSIRPGVDVLRVRKTTQLYVGMKAHYGVSLFFEGHSVARVNGHESIATPGTIQLKEPGQVHRDVRRDRPGTFQLISFDAEMIDASRAALQAPRRQRDPLLGTVQLAANDARGDAFRRLHSLVLAPAPVRTDEVFAIDVAITEALASFTSLLSEAEAQSRGAHRPRLHTSVRRAHTFLLDNYAEHVTLDALADHARVDKFHLCRAFTAEIGLPPYAFLTQARIARGRVLLRRGVRPSDLAPLIGFCDQSQMHRHFVRIVGCTPGEYALSTRRPERKPLSLLANHDVS